MDTVPLSYAWILQLQLATMVAFPLFINLYGGEFFNTTEKPENHKHQSIFLILFNVLVYLSVYASIVMGLSIFLALMVNFHLHVMSNPTNRVLRGYERIGKTVGSALLFFGNIGMYYYTEKSVELMFFFLSLAYFCLCILALIQPYTDFGIFDFLLSASLNQALSLFGLRNVYSWLVLCACIFIAWVRYKQEPIEQYLDQDNSRRRDSYLPVAVVAGDTTLR